MVTDNVSKEPKMFNEHNAAEKPTVEITQAGEKMHNWYLKLNDANPAAIRAELVRNSYLDEKAIHRVKLACTGCYKGKLARKAHRKSRHLLTIGGILCTAVMGPLYPAGLIGEKYIITFTDLGSRYTFFIAIKTLLEVTTTIKASLMYIEHIRGMYRTF